MLSPLLPDGYKVAAFSGGTRDNTVTRSLFLRSYDQRRRTAIISLRKGAT
jgi:hypothetical protein